MSFGYNCWIRTQQELIGVTYHIRCFAEGVGGFEAEGTVVKVRVTAT